MPTKKAIFSFFVFLDFSVFFVVIFLVKNVFDWFFFGWFNGYIFGMVILLEVIIINSIGLINAFNFLNY